MPVEVKVCGLTDAQAVGAAVAGGARWLGFVFYPPSPRSLTPARAAELAALAPPGCAKVGVMVDPTDEQLAELLTQVPLDFLQLHGSETPERVAEIRARTGRRVIKAIKVAEASDLGAISHYGPVTDLLMFDAKAKEPGSLPGGNALSFDWRLLQGLELDRPWLLSGGLDADNLVQAVQACGAGAVDVSSGVEARPGQKDPARISRFLAIAASLEPQPRSVSEHLRENA